MLIKEAAARAALTERAVRLYEERGLISPRITVKNGRDFREYDEDDVETLKTISALRRARFSLDEIEKMIRDPSTVAGTVEANRQRMRKEDFQLSYILSRMDAVCAADMTDASSLARAIFAPRGKGGAAGGTEEAFAPGAADVPAVDEPTTEETEEVARVYEKYFAENARWEKRYDAHVSASRAVGAVGRFFRSKAVIAAVAILIAVLAVLSFPRVTPAEYSYTGEMRSADGTAANVQVNVNGQYVRRVIGGVRFRGYIETDALANASGADVPARFSFDCRVPDGEINDESAAALDDYVFSSNGPNVLYGIFAGADMDSLAFFTFANGGVTSFSLSRGGDFAAGRYLAHVFPGFTGDAASSD